MVAVETVVDVAFPVRGTVIPADHGFALYAALSRLVPDIHRNETVGIHPIRGRPAGGRQLALTPDSRLILRLPAAQLPPMIRLAGQRLELDGARVSVGVPSVQNLTPAVALASRMVVIKGFLDAEVFLDAVRRQLDAVDIAATPSLLRHRHGAPLEGGTGSMEQVVRRTLRIHGKEIVGFAMQVDGLTAADSLRLQVMGLGGRRRFGCGIFIPAEEGQRSA